MGGHGSVQHGVVLLVVQDRNLVCCIVWLLSAVQGRNLVCCIVLGGSTLDFRRWIGWECKLIGKKKEKYLFQCAESMLGLQVSINATERTMILVCRKHPGVVVVCRRESGQSYSD